MRMQTILLLCIFLLQSNDAQNVTFDANQAVDLLLLIDFRVPEVKPDTPSPEAMCASVKDTFSAARNSSLRVALSYLVSIDDNGYEYVPVAWLNGAATPVDVEWNCSRYRAQYAYKAAPFRPIYNLARDTVFVTERGDRPAPDVVIYVFSTQSDKKEDFTGRINEALEAGFDIVIGMQDFSTDKKVSYVGVVNGTITNMQPSSAPNSHNALLKLVKGLISECPKITNKVTPQGPCHYRPHPTDPVQLQCVRQSTSNPTRVSKYCWKGFVEYEKCGSKESGFDPACDDQCEKKHMQLWPCNATCAQDGVLVKVIENATDPLYMHCPTVYKICKASNCSNTGNTEVADASSLPEESTVIHMMNGKASSPRQGRQHTPGGKKANKTLRNVSLGLASFAALLLVIVIVLYFNLIKIKKQLNRRMRGKGTATGQSPTNFTSSRTQTQTQTANRTVVSRGSHSRKRGHRKAESHRRRRSSPAHGRR